MKQVFKQATVRNVNHHDCAQWFSRSNNKPSFLEINMVYIASTVVLEYVVISSIYGKICPNLRIWCLWKKNVFVYSRICRERPLWNLEQPTVFIGIHVGRLWFVYLLWGTTCLERQLLLGRRRGLSRQVLGPTVLYDISSFTECQGQQYIILSM